MKEVFYSEVLDKYFESKDACVKAELQYNLKKKAEEDKKKAEVAAAAEMEKSNSLISKEKKALSDAIEAADIEVTNANNEYKLARNKYNEAVLKAKETYLAAVKEAEDSILKPAGNVVKVATEKRYNAILAFNKKFGDYTVRLTGEKAYKEMQKTMDYMNSVFRNFWNF